MYIYMVMYVFVHVCTCEGTCWCMYMLLCVTYMWPYASVYENESVYEYVYASVNACVCICRDELIQQPKQCVSLSGLMHPAKGPLATNRVTSFLTNGNQTWQLKILLIQGLEGK